MEPSGQLNNAPLSGFPLSLFTLPSLILAPWGSLPQINYLHANPYFRFDLLWKPRPEHFEPQVPQRAKLWSLDLSPVRNPCLVLSEVIETAGSQWHSDHEEFTRDGVGGDAGKPWDCLIP